MDLSVFVWTIMDMFGSYSCMLVNSDLSPVNSDLSLVNSDLSVPSAYLSINLYPRSYHNLADQCYSHTAHTR